MKMLNKVTNIIKKVSTMLALSFFSVTAFADDAGQFNNLTDLNDVLHSNGAIIFKITVAIATIAGIILIIKGLVHLKQNYTGTGQEKHLSKGIASLGFGTALILAIPIAHALVGSASGGKGTDFSTGVAAEDQQFASTETSGGGN